MELGEAEKSEIARNEAVAKARRVLRSIPEDDLNSRTYSQAQACLVLDKDAKTMRKAREERTVRGAQAGSIHPLNLASIHHIHIDGVDAYPASELINYLDRVEFAGKLSIVAQKDPKKYTKSIQPTSLLGFQTWLGEASADETWPFCIQPSGRPVDFVAALVLQKTTNDIRWLTIREFSTMAADCASNAFVQADQIVLEDTTPAAKKAEDEPNPGRRSTKVRV